LSSGGRAGVGKRGSSILVATKGKRIKCKYSKGWGEGKEKKDKQLGRTGEEQKNWNKIKIRRRRGTFQYNKCGKGLNKWGQRKIHQLVIGTN